MNRIDTFKKSFLILIAASVLTVAAVWQTPNALASTLALSNSPLFLLNSVDPNIVVTVDDSGSMAWGFVPDCVGGMDSSCPDLTSTKQGCAPQENGLAYNPAITYTAPLDATGASLGDSTFTNAWFNGYQKGVGGTPYVNLSTSYQYKWVTNYSGTSSASTSLYNADSCGTPLGTAPQAAFYVEYDSSKFGTGTCPVAGDTTNDDCYTIVTPIPAAQQTNFANWYSYYSTRSLMVKGAASRAFATLGTNVRVGYQHLNTCGSYDSTSNCNFLGSTPTASCPGSIVKPFSGTDRANFFTWLFNTPANNSTPLVPATYCVGKYMQSTNANGPWAQTPGTSIGTEYTCRQNFSVVLTDGFWNSPSWGIGGNQDASTVTLPDGTVYNPATLPANRQIYPDTNSNYLADNSFYFWSHDLRPDFAVHNNVPTVPPGASMATLGPAGYWDPANDPASWPHLVQFTVGLGVNGLLSYPTDYNNLLNGTKNWNGGDHVDDLWHSAVDSRGQYFDASNPQTLVDSFTSILNNIAARVGAAAGLSVNGDTISTGSVIYQPKFNSSSWTGDLLALSIDTTPGSLYGTVNSTPTWDAATVLNTQSYDLGRNIITYDPATNSGIPFRWASLDPTTEQTPLNTNPVSMVVDGEGQARLNYLRGDSSNEGTGYNFRQRTCYSGVTSTSGGSPVACNANNGHLGDIIDSSPVYVGAPPFGYPDSLETSPYSTFASNYQGRTSMIYAGSNDGMLHGFDATSGQEKIAFVPSTVFPNLSKLTAASYTHNYFVDGAPTAGDVFINVGGTPQWRTVLIGGLRNGGMSYYALDVTDPTQFSESNASKLVLWQFSDPDLGYTYSQPIIAKMANGKWAAIFGNGYNNTGSGHAVLYIVFIGDGIGGTWSASSFVKIDTGVGSTTTPNGLATPAVVDVNGDNIVDYIYAGDLQGNLWRFDVTSATTSNWTSATNRSKLFVAKDASGNVQPITSAPMVGSQTGGLGGYMVYFGTGKYLEPNDNTVSASTPTESFYGIWDKAAGATVARSSLLKQTITDISNPSPPPTLLRSVTNTAITWNTGSGGGGSSYLGWYADLPDSGEMVVANPILRDGKIIFSTFVPSTDPCSPGGTGWIMELNATNGGQLPATFDINHDGSVDSSDQIGGAAPAGIQLGNGALGGFVIMNGPPGTPIPHVPGSPSGCTEYKFSASGTNGAPVSLPESCQNYNVRKSWIQLK
ncbi:MAG: pilus assembly protein [Acidiferrobacterales bacterium]